MVNEFGIAKTAAATIAEAFATRLNRWAGYDTSQTQRCSPPGGLHNEIRPPAADGGRRP